MANFFQFVGAKYSVASDCKMTERGRLEFLSELPIVRSLFRYFKAGEAVLLNLAFTKLVVINRVAKRTFRACSHSLKEVQNLLYGPDPEMLEGAGDYALMIVMPRFSIRVAEDLHAACFINQMESWTLDSEVRVPRGQGKRSEI